MLRFLALLVVLSAVHTEQQLLYPYGYRQISLPLTTSATYTQPATTWAYSSPLYSTLYRPAYSFGTYQYTYPNTYSWQYQKQYQPVQYQYAPTTQYASITPRYSTVSYSTRGSRALAIAGQTPQQQIQPVQPVQPVVQSYSHQQSQQIQQQQQQQQQQSVAFVPVVPVQTGPTGLDQVRIHQQQAIQTQQPYIAGGLVPAPIQSQPIVSSQQPQQQPQQQFVATVVPVQTQPQFQQQYHTGFQPVGPQTPVQAPVVYAPVQSESIGQQQQQQQQFIPQPVAISPQFVQPVAIPSVPVAYASGTPVVSAGPAPVAPVHHQESLGHHQVSHVSIPGQVGVGGGYTSSAFYEAAPSAVVIPAEPIGASDVKITGKVEPHHGQQQQQQQHHISGHHQSSVQPAVQSYDGKNQSVVDQPKVQ